VLQVLVVALVLLASLDVAAALVAERLRPFHSYDEPRNPSFLRAWPTYTAPRARPAHERLVIVIGNSQAFGSQGLPAEAAWPARLGEGLSAARPTESWAVANWAIYAGTAAEFVVLGAQAGRHAPDAVILATTGENVLGRGGGKRLRHTGSDVRGLLAQAEVRRRLPGPFLERHAALGARGWIRSVSGLQALRSVWAEPSTRAWNAVPPGERRSPAGLPDCHRGPWPGQDRGVGLLQDFLHAVRADDPELPLLLLDMPLCLRAGEGACPAHEALQQVAREALADQDGVRVLDALRLIDCADFVHNAHLGPAGAEQLATWLSPHVLDLAVGHR